jgi:hypothetical protein
VNFLFVKFGGFFPTKYGICSQLLFNFFPLSKISQVKKGPKDYEAKFKIKPWLF